MGLEKKGNKSLAKHPIDLKFCVDLDEDSV